MQKRTSRMRTLTFAISSAVDNLKSEYIQGSLCSEWSVAKLSELCCISVGKVHRVKPSIVSQQHDLDFPAHLQPSLNTELQMATSQLSPTNSITASQLLPGLDGACLIVTSRSLCARSRNRSWNALVTALAASFGALSCGRAATLPDRRSFRRSARSVASSAASTSFLAASNAYRAYKINTISWTSNHQLTLKI